MGIDRLHTEIGGKYITRYLTSLGMSININVSIWFINLLLLLGLFFQLSFRYIYWHQIIKFIEFGLIDSALYDQACPVQYVWSRFQLKKRNNRKMDSIEKMDAKQNAGSKGLKIQTFFGGGGRAQIFCDDCCCYCCCGDCDEPFCDDWLAL